MAAHRYWRLNVSASWGGARIAVTSLEMATTTAGANIATGTGTGSASSAYYPASSAFDNSTTTAWGSDTTGTAWLKWDFGLNNAKDIKRISIVQNSAGGFLTDSYVRNGTLEYSDNDSSWTVFRTITNQTQADGTYNYYAPEVVTVSISGPMQGASGYFGSGLTASSPMQSVTSFGGSAAELSAPAGLSYGSIRDSTGKNAANITAPKATLSVYLGMGAKPKAPIAKLVASGTTQNWLTANVAGPAGTLSASGTFAETVQGSVTAPMATLIGYGGMVASVTLTGSPKLTASITTGGVASTNIVGPMATLDLFEVTTEAFGTANILAPMGEMGRTLQAWVLAPMARLDAVGTAVVAATYEAYAVNLLHPPAVRGQAAPVDETTRYTNFPFTHVVRYRNSYYGANSTGLYLLEGTTDDGVDIPYTLRTAISDFKSPYRKTVASAYFGGRLGPDATMTLYAGEGAQTQAYSYTTPRGALAQNYRQAFGKGIRQHRYYAVGVSGSDAMALDSLELDTHNSTRRI